jgi:hypothetical protein
MRYRPPPPGMIDEAEDLLATVDAIREPPFDWLRLADVLAPLATGPVTPEQRSAILTAARELAGDHQGASELVESWAGKG